MSDLETRSLGLRMTTVVTQAPMYTFPKQEVRPGYVPLRPVSICVAVQSCCPDLLVSIALSKMIGMGS